MITKKKEHILAKSLLKKTLAKDQRPFHEVKKA